MKHQTHYYFISLVMAVMTLLLVACGGSNQLIYQVAGAASEAEVTYTNSEGNSQTETVTLPWETSFDVGSSGEFSLIADNTTGQGDISCVVLLNEKELGRADANYYAGCRGKFKKSGGSLSVDFSSNRDVLPDGSAAGPQATSTPAPPPATPTPSANDRIKQGIAYSEQGELDKAIAEFKEAIALEPDNPSAYRHLGTVYEKQGKWEESVAAYEQAIELDPDFGEAYGNIVAAYNRLGEVEKAVAAGEKAIELAPDYATAHNNLGVAYELQGQVDKGITEYQEAIRLDPDFSSPHYNLGLVYAKQGQVEQAIAEWRESIRLNPNDATPHYNLGLLYYKQGQVEQAIAEWEETVRLDPNDLNAHENLGVAYSELNRAAEALAEFEIYLQLAPDAPDRAAVEEEIAKLTAQLSASSEEGQSQQDSIGYTDDYITLTYPAGWQTFDPTQQAACQHPDIVCFLAVGDPADGTNLNVMRITMPEPSSVEAADQELWGAFESNASGVVLESRLETEIGGLPAVERVFSSPSSSTPDGQAYLRQFYVVSGSFLFQFTAWAPTAEARAQHQSEMDAILAGVQFAPGTTGPSPESVVQVIFEAAKSGDFAPLKDLCDPLGENDSDTQMICDMATDDTNREEFVEYFVTGKISGEARISRNGAEAEVPFLFGPDGDREETMNLINRDGQWYLSSF